MAEPEKKSKKIDLNDVIYYAGLAMLFAGLALTVSIGVALIVVGSVLAGVSLANSYVIIYLGRKS